MTNKSQTATPNSRYRVTNKPITYHPAFDQEFEGWAAACRWDPQSLRQASQQAIRGRHHEATIEQESHKARGIQPDVFSLSLGSVNVYYTVEAIEIVIRGYGYEIDHEPLDYGDGGGFYADNAWSIEGMNTRQYTDRSHRSTDAGIS